MRSYAVCSTPGGSGSGAAGRQIGADRHRARPVAVGDLHLRADAFDPRGAVRAGDARDHDRRAPVGGGALHHARATRSRLEVHDEPVVGGARRSSPTCGSAALTPASSPSVTRSWSITCEPCAPNQPPPRARVGPPRGNLGRAGRRARERAARRWRGEVRRSRPERTVRASVACPGSQRNSVPSRCTMPAASAAASTVAAFGRVARERLLADHVLPRRDRRERELGVRVRGSRDRDRVDAVERERVVERGQRDAARRTAGPARACARDRARRPPSRRSRRRAARARG